MRVLLVFLSLWMAEAWPRCAEGTCALAPRGVSAQHASDLRMLLPVGKVTADVMETVAPLRLQELTAKLQLAIQERPEWWMEHVQRAVPGQPLPYHQNLGLSEAEYEEFLKTTTEVRIQKVGRIQLEVVPLDSVRYRWDSIGAASALDGIIVDLERSRVTTPLGDCHSFTEVHASEDQRATGPWSGLQCNIEELDPALSGGRAMTFALGRMVNNGRGILYYRARMLVEGHSVQNETLILQYDLPTVERD